VILPGEDEAAFEMFRDELFADLAPSGPVEALLADRVIHSAACRDFTERHITKRDFLRKTAHAGIGFSAFATTFLGKGRPFGALSSQGTNLAAAQSPPDVEKWLKEVGGKFKARRSATRRRRRRPQSWRISS
jgi:hypothetical protein